MYEDKTLVCKECGNEFVFTAGEQEFYAERGFTNEPQRCKACRDARKNAGRPERGFTNEPQRCKACRDARKNAGRPERVMYTATCATCGAEAKVPFEPKEGRPVYCSECFAKLNAE